MQVNTKKDYDNCIQHFEIGDKKKRKPHETVQNLHKESFMRGKEKEICGLESLELLLLCRSNLFVNVILE